MELKKIEGILTALGYIEGTIEQIKVDETADGLDISFRAIKKKAVEEVPEIIEERVRTDEKKDISKIPYPIRVPKINSVPLKNSDSSESAEKKSDYKKAPNRNTWKTPVPRMIIRYIYFKNKLTAEEFIKRYGEEFELRKDQVNRDEAVRCELTPTTRTDPFYYDGYPFRLSFRMNGAAFEVLENCENLKKRKIGKRGGDCIRFKD